MSHTSIVLRNAQSGRVELQSLWDWLKPQLLAGHQMTLEARKAPRSSAQNRLLHARIGCIAAQVDWAGGRRDSDTWKRLLTAAWLRARGEAVELLPALDGHGVDVVFRRTSSLTRKECVELSDYILHWGDEHGVRWTTTALGRDWPDEVAA